MVCKSRIHQSFTPSDITADVPNPTNLVIANSTVNFVGRNQNNYDRPHSGPIPGTRFQHTHTVVHGYYTTTPYLNVYPVYGVFNSPILLSPLILMNTSGHLVAPPSPPHENQAQHRVSPSNNPAACLYERLDEGAVDQRGLSQPEGHSHAPRDVSTLETHPYRISQTPLLEGRRIASNCNCRSRQCSPASFPSLSDFVVGSSTGQTVDRQVLSHEATLTPHCQPCAHASSPTHLPRPPHDPTNESLACREHPSQASTSTSNCNEIAAEKSLNSCRCEQSSEHVHRVWSGETSQGNTLHHTISPVCPSTSRSPWSLHTPPTVSELTKSGSLPKNIDGRPESRPSSPRPTCSDDDNERASLTSRATKNCNEL